MPNNKFPIYTPVPKEKNTYKVWVVEEGVVHKDIFNVANYTRLSEIEDSTKYNSSFAQKIRDGLYQYSDFMGRTYKNEDIPNDPQYGINNFVITRDIWNVMVKTVEDLQSYMTKSGLNGLYGDFNTIDNLFINYARNTQTTLNAHVLLMNNIYATNKFSGGNWVMQPADFLRFSSEIKTSLDRAKLEKDNKIDRVTVGPNSAKMPYIQKI